ncbi:rod shape-determining protein MreD [Paenibacillus turpanensis]|uniref:rod shape-determining protein MreD n=1 Tax=Paenibacillus turpanensis TaxID=2689078 RepID=UPI00140A4520|nr:rod shape-determining protein MreD [Paenibacillus turpanensis]
MKTVLQRYFYWIALFILFLLEGSLVPWILPVAWQSTIHAAPHLVLVGVLFLGVFTNRHLALFTGLAFGFLHDIVHYGIMIGVHAFALGLCGYLAGVLTLSARRPFVVVMTIVTVCSACFELALYLIYHVFQVHSMSFNKAFTTIMLPSLLITLLFSLVIYAPARKLLQQFKEKSEEKGD